MDIFRSIAGDFGRRRAKGEYPSVFWMGCMQPFEHPEVIVA